jgi:DNA-binding NtrC family response regulator
MSASASLPCVGDPHPEAPARKARILVVEDSNTLRRGISLALSETWSEVSQQARGDTAVEWLEDPDHPSYDVVVTDLRLPGADGIEILKKAQQREPHTRVILMTAYGNIETAVEAMQSGAFDFIQKPFELEQLELRVGRAVDQRRLLAEVADLRIREGSGLGREELVAHSPAMKEAVELAEQVAKVRSTVLITGETGTGKEVIAGLIHAHSPRASGPFVKLNCAALPETLLESELFGHERGAFTGADRQRIGRFEEASGGTLLLDEIAEISPTTQAKLLRVMNDQEFYRLGGTQSLRTDARIVASTNRDLRQSIADESFREDLYFRLNVIEIPLAPLRERREDLVALAENYLQHFGREFGHPQPSFTRQALDRITAHGWPGNVRELKNAVERSLLLARKSRLDAVDLEIDDARSLAPGQEGRIDLSAGGISLRDMERQVVLAALQRAGFVQKEAAVVLGISSRKLNYMIKRMGLTHRSWRRNRSDE